MGYPDRASEREILRSVERQHASPAQPVLTAEDILQLQAQAGEVRVDDALVDYIMSIVEKTRAHDSLSLGVSPRGSQALYRATQALALLEGREYAIPDDVKRLAVPVFAHRVVINTRVALAQRTSELAELILADILTTVEVPL
jgi:MoxR-like ATPase